MNRDISIVLESEREPRQMRVTAVSRLTVKLTTGFEADEFDFSIPNQAGQYTGMFRDTDGKKVTVSIREPVVFTGFCDEASFRMVPERIVSVHGRDNTGILIDECMSASLAASLAGRTGCGIVERVAREFGFTASADRTTRVWADSNLFPEGTSVWGVLVQAAQKEGYDLYVTAEKVIVFAKRVLPAETSRVYVIPSDRGRFVPQPGAIVPATCEFHQDKTLALGLKVKVIGFNQKRKQRIVFTAESRLRNRPHYKLLEVVDFSLGTKAEVRARAESLLAEISKDLVTGIVSGAVDPGIRPGQGIEVQFAGKQDQALAGRYFVTGVRHELVEDGTFTTEVDFASRPLTEARDVEVEEQS